MMSRDEEGQTWGEMQRRLALDTARALPLKRARYAEHESAQRQIEAGRLPSAEQLRECVRTAEWEAEHRAEMLPPGASGSGAEAVAALRYDAARLREAVEALIQRFGGLLEVSRG